MSNEQIVEYCKNIVLSNLRKYTDTPSAIAEVIELESLKGKESDNRYLEHFKGLKELLERAIEIVEKGK